MKTTATSRALTACCVLAGAFTLFSARLIHLQVTDNQYYSKRAMDNHVDRVSIPARRGAVLDIHGEPLAQNEPVKRVIADGTLIKERDAIADLLAGPLEMPRNVVLQKISREVFSRAQKKQVPAPYVIVKNDVPESVASEISSLLENPKRRGIYFEQNSTRVYPNGKLLCHVLGFVNGEGDGVEGIERTMDSYLRGNDGFRYIERDRTGQEIVPYRGQERAPRNGCNVRLTIDMGLQNIVETELDATVKQLRPKGATVILMRPQTGEILALANRPNFNPNAQQDVTSDQRRNRAMTDMVEPGSTFKIVTVAAALSERIVGPGTFINCENGYYDWCKLRDHHPYSDLSVNDILVRSSNIGVAKLAIQLGDQKFYEYVRKFGFGDPTNVTLPGEARGIIHPPHRWSKISITRMPMGQEVGATAIQVATAMCAIANGGELMMPQIIHEITDDEGKVISTFPPQFVRRVATKQATAAVRSALADVVNSKIGTAAGARVPGFKAAGKTGTAQKIDPDGRYSHKRHVCSFVGFLPAEDPAFVALVIIDEATQVASNLDVGGLVAAPTFQRIAEKAARYLGLEPTEVPPVVLATK